MTVIKTINALSDAIEQVFDVAPLHKDILEGFDRPATFLGVDGITVSSVAGTLDEVIALRITRFATQDYKGYLDIVKYAETLGALLTCPIRHSSGMYVYPDNVSIKLYRDDMVMECTFTITNCTQLENSIGYDGGDSDYFMQYLHDTYIYNNNEE